MKIPSILRSRLALGLTAGVLIAAFFSLSSSHVLRGSLFDDRMTALADTDHDGTLSIREMRKVIVKMIQAIITNDRAYDINASGKTDRSDLLLLIASIRLSLSEVSPRAFVVNAGSETLQIYDRTDPLAPVSLGSVKAGSTPLGVAVRGLYAYVVNSRSNTLQTFNILDPHTPVSVGTVVTGLSPSAVTIRGLYAYVVNLDGKSLQVFSLTNPRTPVLLKTVATAASPSRISVIGRYAYILEDTPSTTGVLQIFDLANPASPVSLGSAVTFHSPHAAIAGAYAYVAAGAYLDVYDLRNPQAPKSIRQVATLMSDLQGIVIQGTHAYIVGSDGAHHTLEIFDLTDPVAPVSVGSVAMTASSSDIAIDGAMLYVLHGDSKKLESFDLTNPIVPVSAGMVATGIGAYSLFIPSLTHVIECGDGLQEASEQCDDGNFIDTDACTSACKTPVCGDHFVRSGHEQCDSDPILGLCNADCTLVTCGNGRIEGAEQCDDGNAVNTDDCTNACKNPVCGDQIVWTGHEACDDDPGYGYAFCNRDCTRPVCGNGMKEGAEQCDDANRVNDDGCTNACTAPRCGDFVVQIGEECDGNGDSSHPCTARCTIPVCGNGIVETTLFPYNGYEYCDDGNTVSRDGCDSTCHLETHLVCENYQCVQVAGYGQNTCGNDVSDCLPPPNDGIGAEVTVSKNPIVTYEPSTVTIKIHPDKIRTRMNADITLGILNRDVDDTFRDSRCTRVIDTGNYPMFHLSCTLGTINPATDITIVVPFTTYRCPGVTSAPSGIFDVPLKLLIKDSAGRPIDAPPLVPLTVNMPYKCKPMPATMGLRDASCTEGFYGFSSNDLYIERTSTEDPVTHEAYIFGQRTNTIGFFRYTPGNNMIISDSMMPVPSPGFVSDARFDSSHHVVSFLFQSYDILRGQLGSIGAMCLDPATNQINGGACLSDVIDHYGLPGSPTVGRDTNPWKRCFYRP